MPTRSGRKVRAAKAASPLMVRLDEDSKRYLADAAGPAARERERLRPGGDGPAGAAGKCSRPTSRSLP